MIIASHEIVHNNHGIGIIYLSYWDSDISVWVFILFTDYLWIIQWLEFQYLKVILFYTGSQKNLWSLLCSVMSIVLGLIMSPLSTQECSHLPTCLCSSYFMVLGLIFLSPLFWPPTEIWEQSLILYLFSQELAQKPPCLGSLDQYFKVGYVTSSSCTVPN